MIGLSLTSTVRRVEAERDEARYAAEKAAERADYWRDCWRVADRRNGQLAEDNAALSGRIDALQAQIDAQPVRGTGGRFTKRVPV